MCLEVAPLDLRTPLKPTARERIFAAPIRIYWVLYQRTLASITRSLAVLRCIVFTVQGGCPTSPTSEAGPGYDINITNVIVSQAIDNCYFILFYFIFNGIHVLFITKISIFKTETSYSMKIFKK